MLTIYGGELCLEEMERAHPQGVREGVAGWVATNRGQDPAETVSALAVGKRYPMRRVHRVTALAVPNAGPEW
jgi:hypothetical protein